MLRDEVNVNTRGKRVRIGQGIYQDAHGISVIAQAGTYPNKVASPEVRFTLGTPMDELKACWAREKAKLLESLTNGAKARRGTLSTDVAEYFRTRTLSKQLRQERMAQLSWWCERFGDRVRGNLQPVELQQAMKTLKLSASTVDKYRQALSNLFVVLDGKNAANPFRDIPKLDQPEARPLDVDYDQIEVLLANVGDKGWHGKGESKTKARLRVLAYAPVTLAQLALMDRSYVNYKTSEMTAPARHKGGGSGKGKRKGLTPQGLAAFRAYEAAGCWEAKRPSNASMARIFRNARDKAVAELRKTKPDIDTTRLAQMARKDLRHSFGVMVLRATGDLNVTADYLDHKNTKTTERYVQSEMTNQLRQAGIAVNDVFAKVKPYVPQDK